MQKIKKRYITLAGLVLILAFWAVLLYFFDPQEIVDRIGVENTYLIVFLVAVFGGLSTLTGTSFFLTVVTFASSGASPLLLGLVGGIGIFISDAVFFFIARYGVKTLEAKSEGLSHWVKDKIESLSPWEVIMFVYIYLGFTPLPNDLLMIALALSGMSFKRLAPVLLLGSITVVTVTAYVGENIFSYFLSLF